MKVDQNLSLRLWHIHIKIIHRYARGSCCPPKRRDGWWLKTMLLHTICSVISVKLLMINNSCWCVVYKNLYVSIGSCIVCHCIERTSLMIQRLCYHTFWRPSVIYNMHRPWKQTVYLGTAVRLHVPIYSFKIQCSSYECLCKVVLNDRP